MWCVCICRCVSRCVSPSCVHQVGSGLSAILNESHSLTQMAFALSCYTLYPSWLLSSAIHQAPTVEWETQPHICPVQHKGFTTCTRMTFFNFLWLFGESVAEKHKWTHNIIGIFLSALRSFPQRPKHHSRSFLSDYIQHSSGSKHLGCRHLLASFVDDSETIETSDGISVNIKSAAATELGSIARQLCNCAAQQQVSKTVKSFFFWIREQNMTIIRCTRALREIGP